VGNTYAEKKEYMTGWRQRSTHIISLQNKRMLTKRKSYFDEGTMLRAESKKCSICKKEKEAKEFYLSNTNKDGLHGWCKVCSDQRTTENAHKRMHGLSPQEVAKMKEDQLGRCALCGSLPVGKKKLCLDHDHESGKVRGLLCTCCNTMLGNAHDSIEILDAAIAYLRRNG
jgi:hypothetical protein